MVQMVREVQKDGTVRFVEIGEAITKKQDKPKVKVSKKGKK